MSNAERWPDLPYAAWKDTRDTLHLWTQVIGKIRLAATPWMNHSWHVTLYVTARGLTTGPMPSGARTAQIDFDFIDHVLWLRTSDGHFRQIMLKPMPVAEFYGEVMGALDALCVPVAINPAPQEIPETIPFGSAGTGSSFPARRSIRCRTPRPSSFVM